MDDSRRGVGAGIFTLLAGSVIVAGTLLDWFDVATGAIGFQGGRVDPTYTGLQSGAIGWLAFIAGGSIVLAGLVLIVRRSPRAASIVAAVAGLIAMGIGVYQLSRLDQAFVDVAASNAANDELPAEKITDLLAKLIDAGQVDVGPGIGLYLVLAGGLVAAVVGFIGILRSGDRQGATKYQPPVFATPDETRSDTQAL